MITIHHLIGFSLISPRKIQLDNSFNIKKLSELEIQLLKDKIYKGKMTPFYSRKAGLFFDSCIDSKLDIVINPKTPPFFPTLHPELVKLLVSMWIFRGRAIYIKSSFSYDASNAEVYTPFFTWQEKGHKDIWEANSYQMYKFRRFWNLIKGYFKINNLAIKYFEEALFSSKIDDWIIKLTIAMENVLLPGDDRHELIYRFSTRAAFILDDEFKKRKKIKKLFNKFYRIRSIIVHGSKLKEDDKKYIENNYSNYFHYCRKIISLFIENHGFENQGDWKKLLEDASLGENRLQYNLANLIME